MHRRSHRTQLVTAKSDASGASPNTSEYKRVQQEGQRRARELPPRAADDYSARSGSVEVSRQTCPD